MVFFHKVESKHLSFSIDRYDQANDLIPSTKDYFIAIIDGMLGEIIGTAKTQDDIFWKKAVFYKRVVTHKSSGAYHPVDMGCYHVFLISRNDADKDSA